MRISLSSSISASIVVSPASGFWLADCSSDLPSSSDRISLSTSAILDSITSFLDSTCSRASKAMSSISWAFGILPVVGSMAFSNSPMNEDGDRRIKVSRSRTLDIVFPVAKVPFAFFVSTRCARIASSKFFRLLNFFLTALRASKASFSFLGSVMTDLVTKAISAPKRSIRAFASEALSWALVSFCAGALPSSTRSDMSRFTGLFFGSRPTKAGDAALLSSVSILEVKILIWRRSVFFSASLLARSNFSWVLAI